MSNLDLSRLLIREENFAADMAETAEAFFAAHGSQHTLYREENRPIHLERLLPASAPASASVLIAHGFTESCRKYREMMYYFASAGYAVYAYDQCEHGKSYRLTEGCKVHADGFERYIQDMLYAAHFARGDTPGRPLYLFAHSMGGGIGAAAAAADPELFSRALLNAPMIRPATGGIPWGLTKAVCALFCKTGHAEDYAPGQHAYDGSETFEASASTSRARFQYYQDIRTSDPVYQMCGATYGWLNSAAKLNEFLQTDGWQRIECPVLLLQAENDGFVIPKEQDLFIKKLAARPNSPAAASRLVRIPGTKHELFNSPDAIMLDYLKLIFDFFEEGL